jgi:hypothetical protein
MRPVKCVSDRCRVQGLCTGSDQETESSPNNQNEPTTRLSTPSNMVDRLWRKRAQDDEGAPGIGIMFIEVAMDVQAR